MDIIFWKNVNFQLIFGDLSGMRKLPFYVEFRCSAVLGMPSPYLYSADERLLPDSPTCKVLKLGLDQFVFHSMEWLSCSLLWPCLTLVFPESLLLCMCSR